MARQRVVQNGSVMDSSLFSSITLMTEPTTSLIALGGIELPNSRRYVDFDNAEGCRWQYVASNGIDVRLDYSLDGGDNWATFADEYETIGTSPRLTSWQVIPDEAKTVDVLLRAYATGAGLLTTIQFVEFQFR